MDQRWSTLSLPIKAWEVYFLKPLLFSLSLWSASALEDASMDLKDYVNGWFSHSWKKVTSHALPDIIPMVATSSPCWRSSEPTLLPFCSLQQARSEVVINRNTPSSFLPHWQFPLQLLIATWGNHHPLISLMMHDYMYVRLLMLSSIKENSNHK